VRRAERRPAQRERQVLVVDDEPDIRELLEHGIIVKNPAGGRSTSYRLAETDEIPPASVRP